MQSVNPATGEVLARFEEPSDADVEAALARAQVAFRSWRATTFDERGRLLARAGEILAADKEKLGRLMTLEMGKTLKSAIAEAEKCAWVCRHYAAEADRYLADEEIATSASRSYVRYLPLGPVLAVMPWNFPFWQVFRFAAPALMAGNVGLLKHASNVPQCALAIEEVFRRAGFPTGVFQTLLVGSSRVAPLVADDRIAAVTLTGSEGAGVKIGEAAGRAIKKVVLELGGSDPFVVMPSADLEAAARTGVVARVINNGQSCIAAKRFIVHDEIYDAFERRLAFGLSRLKMGDPMDPSVEVGPLATEQGLRDLTEQVERSVAAGARLVCGGRPPGGPGASKGWFYPPSALADIPESAPAYREEVFGPVALLFRAKDLDDAIRLANDSRYGLGSSVWTNDPDERARFVEELEAGQTFVNAMVASDPRVPFGGVKKSGHGRELGAFGIREFTNAKSVWIQDEQPEERPGTHVAE